MQAPFVVIDAAAAEKLDALQRDIADIKKMISTITPAARTPRDEGWMDEAEFRERYNLKTRYILGQALKEGTVERRVLAPRKYLWRLKPEMRGK